VKRLIINRTWEMPNKQTFQIKAIRELIDKYIPKNAIALDPFPFDYQKDALEYLAESKPSKYGLFDPPYSPRQYKESYKGIGEFDTKSSTWSNWKKALADKILPGGIVISFGWNSGGIGKKYGFEIIEILIVCHGSQHNDTICTVERKTTIKQTELINVI